MKNTINISYANQSFPYIVEYVMDGVSMNSHNIKWNSDMHENSIKLFDDYIFHYKHGNEWYNTNTEDYSNEHIPNDVNLLKLRVYIPAHSIEAYQRGIKYALNAYTWINGKKIDFGSNIFGINDTYAYENGPIKQGNNEYYSCIDFNIINVFDVVYSDDWINFRNIVCGEPLNINTSVAPLYISLYAVEKYEDKFIIKDEFIGSSTCINISNPDEYLQLNISTSLDPLGFMFETKMNNTYDWLLTYLKETYDITVNHSDITLELAIKSKDSVIAGPSMIWNAIEDFGICRQHLDWTYIENSNAFKIFFNDWNTFEEGWNIVGSLNIKAGEIDALNIISNEIPITQEVFSLYTNNGSEKIIDISDMNFICYNVVNKIENNIVQIERPNESKSNIYQPIFYKVNDVEMLTLHPEVTENISINLDDYKGRVEKFILQINGCKFNSIGENKYGVIFKITANSIPADIKNGTYYILDQNYELVTTGKYSCVR